MRALNSTSSILIKLLFYIYRSLSNVTIERENVNKSRLGILIQYITVKSSFSGTNSIQIGVIVDVPLDLSEVLFIISITACEFHVIVTNYIKTSVLRQPHLIYYDLIADQVTDQFAIADRTWWVSNLIPKKIKKLEFGTTFMVIL